MAKRAPSVWTVPASSPFAGGNVTPPGTSTHGNSCMPATAIIIAGKTFVTGGDAEHSGAQRQRTRQPAKHDRGIIAIGQAVEHADRSLRAAVARVGAKPGEWNGLQAAKFFGRRLRPANRFPNDRCDSRAQSASPSGARSPPCVLRMRNCLRPSFGGIPAHAGVLRQAKQIAAGAVQQHVLGDGQTASRPGRVGLNLVNIRRAESNMSLVEFMGSMQRRLETMEQRECGAAPLRRRPGSPTA